MCVGLVDTPRLVEFIIALSRGWFVNCVERERAVAAVGTVGSLGAGWLLRIENLT